MRQGLLATVEPWWAAVDQVVMENSRRVMEAFAASGLAAPDLMGSWGYGYDDRGRAALERIWAAVFGGEAALVRPQWASGTHVLATVLRALLGPGDRLALAGGPVYDTLEPLLFDAAHPLSLPARGVQVEQWDTDDRGRPVPPAGFRGPRPRVVYLQRSRGYQARPSWGEEECRPVLDWAREAGAWTVVDNCYGEFTGTREPPAWGADLAAGSLLKNPGGGIAPTGGYVTGRRELVERVAEGLTAPGLGGEVGPTGSVLRLMLQGLFYAPLAVGEALKGTIYAAALFREAGFAVDPEPERWPRHDIVVAIRLGDPDRVARFCRAVQRWSPVDAGAVPTGWDMPGYRDAVIMAAGGFVPGGSLELSCDAPLRPPYWVYLQGGVNRWHTVLAAEAALAAVQAEA
ncbi:MAG: methionine gamma-lyase family protein [Firmicutes bacterium]|nr:methionine gamma-lyase family protein [Bacillota bacterium]